ncbi:MAG: ABC transporter ATP-binding protein [Thermodesulfobacteriota bacterium]
MRDELRLLLPSFRAGAPMIAAGLAALVLVDGLQLVVPWVMKRAVDELAAGQATGQRLAFHGLAVMALATGIGLLRYVWRVCLLGHARRVEQTLRDQLFAHFLTLSPAFYDRTSAGDLMAHTTNDLESVRMAVGMGMVALVDALLMGTAATAMMIAISPTLAAIAVLPMPALVILAKSLTRQLHRSYRLVQEAFSLITERVRESLAGIRMVRAYGLEGAEVERLAAVSLSSVAANLRRARLSSFFMPLASFFSQLSTALVLLLGGRLVLAGGISLGDFVAFTGYLALLTWPMMAAGWLMSLLQRGSASLGRLQVLLSTRPTLADRPAAARALPAAGPGAITLEHVSFAYAGREALALNDLSITVPAGRITALVGRTGAGKSTVCHLLARFYDPTAGAVFLDGQDLRDLPLAALRSRIGYVPQDTVLFSGTVRENLAFGDPVADDDGLWAVLEEAGILEEVRRLPAGLDTRIGERGITLSGGQKQRLAIARALLTKAPVLVLDDALSAVDAETEQHITRRILAQARGRTFVIVTHRPAAIEQADQIVVLDAGRKVASGSHAELAASCPLYRQIYQGGPRHVQP